MEDFSETENPGSKGSGFFSEGTSDKISFMKHLWLVVVLLFASCSSNQWGDASHSDSLAQSDSTRNGPEEDWLEQIDGFSGEIVDSIGYYDACLWSWVDEGNIRSIELRYTLYGTEKKYLLTDSFPGYLSMTYAHEVVQVNETGDEEIIIRINGYRMHGGAGVTESKGQEQDEYFVFDPGNERMLFNGTNGSEYIYYCGSQSDSNCEDIEAGYDYKVHFMAGAIVLDSVRFLGDTRSDALDHRMGKYQWLDGMFINLD